MGTYADLDLPATSTPRGRRNPGARDAELYATLTFPSSVTTTPAPRERTVNTSATTALPSHDATRVNYTTLHFEWMTALRKTREERAAEQRQRMAHEAQEEERRRRRRWPRRRNASLFEVQVARKVSCLNTVTELTLT